LSEAAAADVTVVDAGEVEEDPHGANTSSSLDDDPEAEETAFSKYHLSSTKEHHQTNNIIRQTIYKTSSC